MGYEKLRVPYSTLHRVLIGFSVWGREFWGLIAHGSHVPHPIRGGVLSSKVVEELSCPALSSCNSSSY